MSYKAAANIKSYIEIEAIKSMKPEDINEILNKQQRKIAELKAQIEAMKQLRECKNCTNGMRLFVACAQNKEAPFICGDCIDLSNWQMKGLNDN